jgi:hypothetical protein
VSATGPARAAEKNKKASGSMLVRVGENMFEIRELWGWRNCFALDDEKLF